MPKKEKQLSIAVGQESNKWKPHTWDTERKQKFIRDVMKHALRSVSDGKLTFTQVELTALVRGELLGLVSYAMLKAAGIKTIGDTWN